MTNKQIVFVTVPDAVTGEKIAETVVRENLAACANLIPGLTSIYVWEGKLEKGSELLMLIKTRADCFEALRDKIVSMHPFKVPEIISVPIEMGLNSYLQWIDDSVKRLEPKK